MKTQRHVWSDSCWIPNGLNGPARDLLTRYLSNTVQSPKQTTREKTLFAFRGLIDKLGNHKPAIGKTAS